MSKIKIVTWNVRCSWDGDGKNSFIYRLGITNEKILAEKPDIIAFQEVTESIYKVFRQIMPEYTFVGHFRSEDYKGEGLFVAIRNDSIDLIGTETIWLSPTPYIPGSRFADQSLWPRIYNIVQIRHKESEKSIRIYNLHLDYSLEKIQEESMKCVFEFIEQYNAKLELPCVILGDFNATPQSNAVKMCNNYSGIVDVTKSIPVTFHDFGKTESKIDYIYMSDELSEHISDVTAWKDEHDGIFLSDHYPVCAELEL